MFENQTILVTGGTGSFGQAFIRTLVEHSRAKKIIVYSRGEMRQTEMETTAPFSDNRKRLRYFIGDVRDKERLIRAMEGVDIVIHSAALKQVPSCEFYPLEALKTNVLGTENVLEAAIASGVRRVVVLSTDKAVYPINAMGISKAMAEKILQAHARNQSKEKSNRCQCF